MVVAYGERRIHCKVHRSATRLNQRVAIHVEPDGHVRLEAPLHATDAQIRQALTRHARWIHRHLTEIEGRLQHITPYEYVSGETLLYLGRRYRLKVILDEQLHGVVRLRGAYLETRVSSRSPAAVRAALECWQRERARQVLPQRVANMAEQLAWVKHPPPSPYGGCSASGAVARLWAGSA
ncbi:YgjP-like metallopeptidase domain-containing protein [Xanthomonas campestris pv. campestris]|uniref:M48 family metallopeptidase n=1 Tax=Xanthomonas campestris TaxID=339 RepID=UPI0038908B4A